MEALRLGRAAPQGLLPARGAQHTALQAATGRASTESSGPTLRQCFRSHLSGRSGPRRRTVRAVHPVRPSRRAVWAREYAQLEHGTESLPPEARAHTDCAASHVRSSRPSGGARRPGSLRPLPGPRSFCSSTSRTRMPAPTTRHTTHIEPSPGADVPRPSCATPPSACSSRPPTPRCAWCRRTHRTHGM